jgi:hypothetical protein
MTCIFADDVTMAHLYRLNISSISVLLVNNLKQTGLLAAAQLFRTIGFKWSQHVQIQFNADLLRQSTEYFYTKW